MFFLWIFLSLSILFIFRITNIFHCLNPKHDIYMGDQTKHIERYNGIENDIK